MKYAGLIAAAAAVASALPSSNYVLHEISRGRSHRKRDVPIDREAIIPLRIGLTQSNLDNGYEKLMEVSHPDSAKFGQHLSAAEVHDLFAPAESSIEAVKAWLIENGVSADKLLAYENRGWIGADVSIKDAERLFRTQYHEHENSKGEIRLGCDQYHVPAHLSDHIDYITPGVKLSPPMKKRSIAKRSGEGWGPPGWGGSGNGNPWGHGPVHIPSWWPQGPWHHQPPPSSGSLPADLQGCALNFTVACYRAIYNIPDAHEKGWNVSGNSLGLYEDGDIYSQTDLDLYFAKYTPYVPQGTAPVPQFIDGAEAPVAAGSPYNTGESDVDLGITIPLVYPQTVTLYQTDDLPQAQLELNGTLEGFLNTFLDALDGSYCDYTAYGITGDSPGIDAQYPDPLPGGYKGPLMCSTYKPTKVISGSYGEGETDLPKKYVERQCNEWMKLGLQGHSVFFSSGDYGVATPPGDVSDTGCLSGSGQNQTIYSPDYPCDCPYITSVGATQLQPNQTINDPESAMQISLGSGYLSRFASGGGFSNYFPTADYQKRAVSEYFRNHDPGHPYYYANADASNIGENGGIYNRGGRGFPDVSANGAFFRMFNNQTDYHFYGTSLAAPLWASVITLINEERALAGKGSVGFINPTLYSNPWALTDIKNGSNPNCGTSGFSAVQGWDPITGLGTPSYDRLLEVFMRLP